jgi:hypothetical protein
MASGISTKDLQKARRNAERKRTSVACARCKAGKTKCSDYRPCKKCKFLNMAGECVDEKSLTSRTADIMPSSVSSDAKAPESCVQNAPFVMQARFNAGYFTRPGPAPGYSHPYSVGNSTSRPVPAVRSAFPGAWNGVANSASSSKESGDSQQIQYHGVHQVGPTPAFRPILTPLLALALTAPRTYPPAVASFIFGGATVAAPRLTAPSIDASLLHALQAGDAAPHPHRLAPIALPPLLIRR